MLHLLNTIFQEIDPNQSRDKDIIEVLGAVSMPDIDSGCEECPFDVLNFLPTWLVDEHYAGNTLYVKFIQHYFDWLYCTNTSSIYMGNLFDIFDIDNINEKTKDSIIKSHIPGFYEIIDEHESKEYVVFGHDISGGSLGYYYPVYVNPLNESYHAHQIQLQSTGEVVTFYMPDSNMNHAANQLPDGYTEFNDDTRPYTISLDKIKTLLKNIKHNLYQRKTTKDAISFFFKTILDDSIDVSVVSPTPATIEITINEVSRADDYFQDLCLKLYEELLHPIGMSYTLLLNGTPVTLRSQQDDNYEMGRRKPKADGYTSPAYEFPELGNYFVYYPDDISTLTPVTGCIDGTPIARGITENHAHMPTYTHPNWNQGYSGGTSFGNINISGFLMLPFEDNPNIGITSCLYL